MSKFYKNKNNRFKNNRERRGSYTRDVVDPLTDGKASNEQPIMNTEVQDGISAVAMKDLPKSTYAIKVDPYTEANQATQKYNWITKHNRKYQPSYYGKANLDGGYVSQYISSVNSRLLNVFDSIVMEIGVNFRYLPLSKYTPATISGGKFVDGTPVDYEVSATNYPTGYSASNLTRGSQILRKMYDAVNEAVSQLDATTFTYLAINTSYSVVSSILIPGVPVANTASYYVETGNGEYTKCYVYNDVAAVILLMAIEYQCILQSGLLAIKQINKMKNAEATVLKMNYNRETGPLNMLYGQFNKQSFAQLLTSIKLNIMGEYVDADWSRTTNIITQLLSRKADDMIDPLLEINPVYNFPKLIYVFARANSKLLTDANDRQGGDDAADKITFKDLGGQACKVWCGGDVAYYTEDTPPVFSSLINDRATSTVTSKNTTATLTLRQLNARINNLTSCYSLLYWSRNTIVTPAVERYNQVVWSIEAIDKILTLMKTKFGDLRTVFDKLNPLGIVNYRKGITVDVTDKFDLPVEDFMLTDDIYKTLLAGSTGNRFDAITGRWTSYSLWDKYLGIPKFDAVSGGAFLSFCTKQMDLSSSTSTDYEYLPVVFTTFNTNDSDISSYPRAVNRLGTAISVILADSTLSSDVNASRLAILPDFDNYHFKAPAVNTLAYLECTAYSSLTDLEKSFAKYLCMNIADAYYDTGYDFNDTIVGIYSYQIDPIEKSMITYAKAYGPFKGVVDTDADMGFAGISSLHKE